MELSIVIVNYNTKKLCAETIQAVIENTEAVEYEIIVVDNSSCEAERFETRDTRVKVLSTENKGFGNACNIGVQGAKGEYLLFLNSDTLVHKNTLDKALSYIKKHENIGILGIKTFLPNGMLDHGCKRGFPTLFNTLSYILKLDRLFPKCRLFGGYRLSYLDKEQNHYVDAVSGAFMLMKKSVFENAGGFDEAIFMHGEDLLLCYNVKRLGFDIFYYSGASMTHLKGQSKLFSKNKKGLRYFYDGLKVFYKKYYSGKRNFFIRNLICVLMEIQYMLSVFIIKIRAIGK